MKIGLVGVGKWGTTLAKKFVELGHEIVCHDRASAALPATGLGKAMPWKEMGRVADALVVATPPQVTKEIAFFCAERGIPALVTKPLLGAEDIMASGHGDGILMVDYVHLHSPLMKRLSDYIDSKRLNSLPCGVKVESIEAKFYGNGPVRGFSPLFDYGPHAVSAVFELLSTCTLLVKRADKFSSGPGKEFWDVYADVAGVKVHLEIGNDIAEQHTRVLVKFEDGSWGSYHENWPEASFEASDAASERTSSHDPLGALVKEFCSSIEHPSTLMNRNDLELSSDVEDTLNKILRAVSSGP